MFTPQQHIDVCLSEREYVEAHTYNEGLALIDIRGSDMDENDNSISLWVTEAEVREIRDALNRLLGEGA